MTARGPAGTLAPARVDARDAGRDLALLTVPAGFGPALAVPRRSAGAARRDAW